MRNPFKIESTSLEILGTGLNKYSILQEQNMDFDSMLHTPKTISVLSKVILLSGCIIRNPLFRY